jgi:hypothetical protein
MRFHGDQPRTMHFGKVRSGELYSVSPMATLGPTVREFSQFGIWREIRDYEKFGIWSEQRLRVRERTRLHETSEVRLREKTSRDRESTVRGFESRRFESSRVRALELDSGVIPTVKSETNKESGKLSG